MQQQNIEVTDPEAAQDSLGSVDDMPVAEIETLWRTFRFVGPTNTKL